MEYKKQIKIQDKNLVTPEIINDLHLKCKTIIRQKNYDADNVIVNIPTMIGMTMSLIEKYKNINGTEKKAVIIAVIKKLFSETLMTSMDLTTQQKENFNLTIKILPELIDILIEISNKKYKINNRNRCFVVINKILSMLNCKQK